MYRSKSKENLKPEQASCAKLNHSKSFDGKDNRISRIKQRTEAFESQIANYLGNDPLDPWLSYIKWCESCNDNDLVSAGIDLKSIYKRCLEQCRGNKLYHSDQRFVDLFIIYAKCYDKNPAKLFDWIFNHGIGVKTAKLYIEWSEVLEKRSTNLTKALEVVEKGIEQNAQPLIQLNEHYNCLIMKKRIVEQTIVINDGLNVTETINKEKTSKENEEHIKKKFAFIYPMLQCNDYDDEEFQFEELRAREYYKAYKFQEETEEKLKSEYESRIEALEKEVKELRSRENKLPRGVRSSIEIPTNNFNRTRDLSNVTKGHFTATRSSMGYCNDDFTNVTGFSHYISTYEPTKQRSENDDDDMDETEDDDYNIHKANEFLNQTEKSASNRSRTMPLNLQEPAQLSILNDITTSTDNKNLNDTSKFIENSFNFPAAMPTDSNIDLARAGCPSNSIYPSPNNKTTSITTFGARDIVNKMFNQTDATASLETLNYRNELMNRNKQDNSITSQQSIYIHNDNQATKTPTFSQHEQLQEQKDSKSKSTDFSIFVDQSMGNQTATNTNLNTFKLPTLPALANKINQDGSLFVYPDQLTENLKQLNRKPLSSIDDLKLLEQEKKSLSSPHMELDFNSQTTMHLTKGIEFEPPAASTRNLRPILNKINQYDPSNNKLHTIPDNSFEVSFEKAKSQNDKDSEKEELLAAHLNNLKDNFKNNAEIINSSEKSISKIISGNNNNEFTKRDINITTKQVKFNLQSDKSDIIISSATKRNITSSQTTQVGVMGISWDYNYMDIKQARSEIEIEQNQTYEMIEQCELMMPTPTKIRNLTVPILPDDFSDDNDDENGEEKKSSQLLTNEKLEKTFNKDYYKLFHNDLFGLDNQSLCDMNQTQSKTTDLNVSKLIGLKQINEFNKLEQADEREEDEDENNKRNTTLNPESLKDDDPMMMTMVTDHDSSMGGRSNNNSSIMTGSSSATTTKTGFLNETIQNAIKDPFSFEVKNRLINRGALDYLKKNPNYACLRTNIPMIKEKVNVILKDGRNYKVLKEIGKGAYAKIYFIENKDNNKVTQYALKVDKQATAWEFYITETIHDRLKELIRKNQMIVNVSDSFVKMHQFMKYNDGCLSAMKYYTNGTLLDLINYHLKTDEIFPYWFVLYLTLEMLSIVDYLHKCQIIHADIKPDNLLINQLPDSINYFDQTKTKCLVLIDFNRSIDLSMLPSEAEFDAKASNKSLLCCEMKSEKTWKYQIDYYGILSSIHCVIFKKYMKTFSEKGRNKISNAIPRQYDKVFGEFFDAYLNIPTCTDIPDLQNEWIVRFVSLFKAELGASFSKSKKYLQSLNDAFKNQQ